MTDAASALGIRLPPLGMVVNNLVKKRWVTRRHSVEDRRAMRLSLSGKGETLVQKIKERIRDIENNGKPMKEAS